MRNRMLLPALLLTVMLVPCAANAQRQRTELGIGLDRILQVGTVADSMDRRKGWAIRLQANIPWKRLVGFRIEGAYAQVQYTRPALDGPIGISETDFAAGGYLRPFIAHTASLQFYGLAGAQASIRASCDLDNAFVSTGFVRCDGGEDFLFGYAAGVGMQFGDWFGVRWFAETKYLANTTAAAGGNMLTLSIAAGK